MSNFCSNCGDPLTIPIEWEYGYCSECLAIRLEQLDEAIWEDEGGFWVDK